MQISLKLWISFLLVVAPLSCSSWMIDLGYGGRGNEVDTKEDASESWAIFPGTKWCGSGSTAANYDDLGSEVETDKCCRQHDYCPDLIEAGQSKHGLTNPASYTRLHCDCDRDFRSCLMDAGTKTSRAVGVTYFQVLNTQCFQEEYPIERCEEYSLVYPKRCVRYKLNKSAPKKWQWFDVPPYY